MNVLIWILICTMCCLPVAADENVVMRTLIDNDTGKRHLEATRSSETRARYWIPPNREVPVRSDETNDTVEIHLTDEGVEPMLVWSKSRAIPAPSFQRCVRLVFYDMIYKNGTVWVLYSAGDWSGCNMYLDRVTLDDKGVYAVEQTTRLFKLNDSGFQPYLMESGKIVLDNDAIQIAFKTFGSSSNVRDRDHPYELWRIDGDSASEIDDPVLIAEFQTNIAKVLDSDDRPRMSKQIVLPKTTPKE